MTDYRALAEEAGLVVDPTRIAVRFREPAPHVMRARVARSALKSAETDAAEPVVRFQVPGEKYTVFDVPGGGGDDPHERLDAALATFADQPEVVDVAPVYRAGPNVLMTTDRVAVGFRQGAAGTLARLERQGYEVLDLRGNEYLVRLPAGQSALAAAKAIRQDPDVVFAEADLVEFGEAPKAGPEEPLVVGSPDPRASAQWARAHTGADVALTLVGNKGSPAVRIAILDTGIDRIHPDLEASMVGVWDATEAKPAPHPLKGDWHGTACAGLAAAIPHNGQGIIGFGGGCSILDVRVLHTDPESGNWKISASALAAGINWAVDQGADVLSMSWFTEKEHALVTTAVANALAEGRKKKGCVVVAGTGNDMPGHADGVKYPARLPGVIAVAATNKKDRPVNRGVDGTNWSSAGGPEVALAAPGIRQWTTDISGEGGLVALKGISGSYTGKFAGTSAATAIVAGVAGLMLTADPELTAADVRDILRRKTVQPAGFDLARLGAGRLDAKEAVKEVIRRRKEREAGKDAPPPAPVETVFVVEETLEVTFAVEA